MSVIAGRDQGFPGLLRHWRKQRRLSQLDLALQSEVSQRHLSFLESGRARPSRQMVLQLTESLDLPLRERNHLLTAAGYSAAYSWRHLDGDDMRPVRQALDLLLTHHEPYPALVVDSEWNLVMANAGVSALFSMLGDMGEVWQRVCPDGPPNVLKMTFHAAGLRTCIENFDELAPIMLNRAWREASARPALRGLITEILAWPDMPGRLAFPDYDAPNTPLMLMKLRVGDVRLSLFTTITTFGTPQDVTTDELRVESFFPADEDSARVLRALASRAA